MGRGRWGGFVEAEGGVHPARTIGHIDTSLAFTTVIVSGSQPMRTRAVSLIVARVHILTSNVSMTPSIEISPELADRLDAHLEDDQTYEELIAELLSMYETEGAFLQEGYSE